MPDFETPAYEADDPFTREAARDTVETYWGHDPAARDELLDMLGLEL